MQRLRVRSAEYDEGPNEIPISFKYYAKDAYFKNEFLSDEDFDADGGFLGEVDPLVMHTGETMKIMIPNTKTRRPLRKGDVIEIYRECYNHSRVTKQSQIKYGWDYDNNMVDTNNVLRDMNDPFVTIMAEAKLVERIKFEDVKKVLSKLNLKPNEFIKDFRSIPYVRDDDGRVNPFANRVDALYAHNDSMQFQLFEIDNGKELDSPYQLHKVSSSPISEEACFLMDPINQQHGDDLRVLKCFSNPYLFESKSIEGEFFHKVTASFFNRGKGENQSVKEFGIWGRLNWVSVMPQILRQLKGILSVRVNVNKTLNYSNPQEGGEGLSTYTGETYGDGNVIIDWVNTMRDCGYIVSRDYCLRLLYEFQNPNETDFQDIDVGKLSFDSDIVDNEYCKMFKNKQSRRDVDCVFLNEYSGKFDASEEDGYAFYVVPGKDLVKHDVSPASEYAKLYCNREKTDIEANEKELNIMKHKTGMLYFFCVKS